MAKYQALEFYAKYARVITKRGSEFAQKVKERRSWQMVEWAKADLDALAKPLYNYNIL